MLFIRSIIALQEIGQSNLGAILARHKGSRIGQKQNKLSRLDQDSLQGGNWQFSGQWTVEYIVVEGIL